MFCLFSLKYVSNVLRFLTTFCELFFFEHHISWTSRSIREDFCRKVFNFFYAFYYSFFVFVFITFFDVLSRGFSYASKKDEVFRRKKVLRINLTHEKKERRKKKDERKKTFSWQQEIYNSCPVISHNSSSMHHISFEDSFIIRNTGLTSTRNIIEKF